MRPLFLVLFLAALAVGWFYSLGHSQVLPDRASRLLAFVRFCSLPSAFSGLWMGYYLHMRAIFPAGPLFVIEKYQDPPDRRWLTIKTEPNENGGTAAIMRTYPRWFYETVELGDVFVPGFCHYRVTRDGRLLTVYIPRMLWAEGFVPLLWCATLLLWLPRPRFLHSWWCLCAAVWIEVWCFHTMVIR